MRAGRHLRAVKPDDVLTRAGPEGPVSELDGESNRMVTSPATIRDCRRSFAGIGLTALLLLIRPRADVGCYDRAADSW